MNITPKSLPDGFTVTFVHAHNLACPCSGCANAYHVVYDTGRSETREDLVAAIACLRGRNGEIYKRTETIDENGNTKHTKHLVCVSG